jgi:hypothetical protein
MPVRYLSDPELARPSSWPDGIEGCVLWTITYLADTLDALRAEGHEVDNENAAHLTSAQHDHINFYGTYCFDLDAELRREGHRPLRVTA